MAAHTLAVLEATLDVELALVVAVQLCQVDNVARRLLEQVLQPRKVGLGPRALRRGGVHDALKNCKLVVFGLRRHLHPRLLALAQRLLQVGAVAVRHVPVPQRPREVGPQHVRVGPQRVVLKGLGPRRAVLESLGLGDGRAAAGRGRLAFASGELGLCGVRVAHGGDLLPRFPELLLDFRRLRVRGSELLLRLYRGVALRLVFVLGGAEPRLGDRGVLLELGALLARVVEVALDHSQLLARVRLLRLDQRQLLGQEVRAALRRGRLADGDFVLALHDGRRL
mmetsp:Transcript_21424/g.73851  ORF Transcript_21424/g.73851 Transcript_21424/m.73851 type:complete len:281 (-) Transcript_21424:944-1786(-)